MSLEKQADRQIQGILHKCITPNELTSVPCQVQKSMNIKVYIGIYSEQGVDEVSTFHRKAMHFTTEAHSFHFNHYRKCSDPRRRGIIHPVHSHLAKNASTLFPRRQAPFQSWTLITKKPTDTDIWETRPNHKQCFLAHKLWIKLFTQKELLGGKEGRERKGKYNTLWVGPKTVL